MNEDVLQAADIQLLTQIGLLGAGAGKTLHAATHQLFHGLMVLRPERDFAYIGMACAHLNLQHPEDAVHVLEQGLRVMRCAGHDPKSEDIAMVQAFLGMTLLMVRRTSEALALLDTVVTNNVSPPALRMAQALLGLPHTETEPLQESA
jgi:hypothetical protein